MWTKWGAQIHKIELGNTGIMENSAICSSPSKKSTITFFRNNSNLSVNFNILVNWRLYVSISQGEECRTLSDATGACVVLSQCPSLTNFVTQFKDDSRTTETLVKVQRSCGSKSVGSDPIVCCKDPQPFTAQKEIKSTSSTFKTGTHKVPRSSFSPSSQPCRDPMGVAGVCRNLKDCPVILSEFMAKNKNPDPAFINYMKQSTTRCQGGNNVCCPMLTKSAPAPRFGFQGRLLTPEEGCGSPNSTVRKIVGGTSARPGEFYTIKLLL